MTGNNRISTFSLGMIVGAIIGIGGTILLLSVVEKPPETVAPSEAKTFHEIAEKPSASEETRPEGLAEKPKKNLQPPVQSKTESKHPTAAKQEQQIVLPDTAAKISSVEAIRPDTILADSLAQVDPDTVRFDSVNTFVLEEDEITIREEVLIKSVRINIVNLDSPDTLSTDSLNDSLSMAASNIRSSGIPAFTIEYWKSPINFKGYKMANNKLVLYGLLPDDGMKLLQLDGQLYLLNQNTYYVINETFDYRSFDIVKEEYLLIQLQKS